MLAALSVTTPVVALYAEAVTCSVEAPSTIVNTALVAILRPAPTVMVVCEVVVVAAAKAVEAWKAGTVTVSLADVALSGVTTPVMLVPVNVAVAPVPKVSPFEAVNVSVLAVVAPTAIAVVVVDTEGAGGSCPNPRIPVAVPALPSGFVTVMAYALLVPFATTAVTVKLAPPEATVAVPKVSGAVLVTTAPLTKPLPVIVKAWE